MYIIKRNYIVTRYYLVGDNYGWDVNSEEEAWNEFHSLDTVPYEYMEVDVDDEEEVIYPLSEAVQITPEIMEICKEKGYSWAFKEKVGV